MQNLGTPFSVPVENRVRQPCEAYLLTTNIVIQGLKLCIFSRHLDKNGAGRVRENVERT